MRYMGIDGKNLGKWIRRSRHNNLLDLPKIATADIPSVVAGFSQAGNEGGCFYDETSETVKYISSTAAVELGSSSTSTLDGAYNADSGERTVTVDGGDVVWDLAAAASNFVLNNTYAGTIAAALIIDAEVGSSVITDAISIITTAGAITDGLDVSDTGITNVVNLGANVLIGTTAVIDFTNFDVDASGNVTCNDLTVGGTHTIATLAVSTSMAVGTDGSGVDATFHTTTAGDNMLWDASQKVLYFTDSNAHFGDNDNCDFGTGSAVGTGDWRIYSNGTHLYIAANADVATQAIYLGDDTNDVDVIWEGDTNASIFQMDSSTNQIELNGADMRFGNDDILHFGDGATTNGDFKVSSDGTDLFIQANANVADQALKIGDHTSNDVDVFIYGVTSGDLIQFDSSADLLTLTDIAFVQTESGAGTSSLDITSAAETVSAVEINTSAALDADKAGLAILSAGANEAGSNLLRLDITGSPNAGAIVFEIDATGEDVVGIVADCDSTGDVYTFSGSGAIGAGDALMALAADGTIVAGGFLLDIQFTGDDANEPTLINAVGSGSGVNVGGLYVTTESDGVSCYHAKFVDAKDDALGVHIYAHQDSASPANDDVVLRISGAGEDAGSAETVYCQLDFAIMEVTAGQEDGQFIFSCAANNGTLCRVAAVSPRDAGVLGQIVVGKGDAAGYLTSFGAYSLILDTNEGGTGASIEIESGTNSDVIITPTGTGEVKFAIGDLTTVGTEDLILDTNEGTNSGSITIFDGVDGDIVLTTNGAGSTRIDEAAVRYQQRDIAAGVLTDTSDNTDGLIQVATDNANDCIASLPAADAQLGLVLTYQHDVDGGNDVVVTCVGADTLDENGDTGNTIFTMANAGEWIQIMAVADNIWAVIARQGGTLA